MITASDAALAQLSLAAYSATPTPPACFTPVTAAAVTPAIDPGATYADGLYAEGNSAALLTTGLVEGQPSLVVAFRGSDDREDALNSLRGINEDYAELADLVATVDAIAASGAVNQVVVTGHSLGGSLAQQYVAAHPEGSLPVAVRGATFGSPGAQLAAAPDARIENVVIADDPAVVLGAHRGEVGAILRADPALADAAAAQAAAELPGITRAEALDSLPFLTANYVNRGDTVVLPGADGSLDTASATGLLAADPARHDPTLYASAAAAAAAGGATVTVPQAPATGQDAYYRGIYGGEYPTGVGRTRGRPQPGELHRTVRRAVAAGKQQQRRNRQTSAVEHGRLPATGVATSRPGMNERSATRRPSTDR